MHKTMMFAIMLIVAIILASSFGLHILPIKPLYNLTAENQAVALYVCPVVENGWTMFSKYLTTAIEPIKIGFFFTGMLVAVVWLWALYQNFLKDKFEDGAFKKPWGYTKMYFWAVVIFLLLINTPNYYRTVTVLGATGEYVLCEENTPNAIPVRAGNVKA